ncbi:MAG: SHOCT domain-containing protein [Eubacteriales bacterium]|nr:SHOCT domain-containing protein [Eubacteriales bacterium]
MAKICLICQKKIGIMEESYPFGTTFHYVCANCNSDYRLIHFKPTWKRTDNKKISACIDNVYKKINYPVEDSFQDKARKGIKHEIEEILQGHSSFEELQNDIGQYFPEETTINYEDLFKVNSANRTFAVLCAGKYITYHSFDELLDYKIVEEGNTLTTGRSGSAAIGMLLAGTSGAIIGSAGSKKTQNLISQLDIVLMFKGLDAKIEEIHLVNTTIDKGSDLYKEKVSLCNKIAVVLKQIVEEKADNSTEDAKHERGARAIYAFSVADEILKFKKLRDDGIITEAEFQTQKQKLLSLDY